MTGRRGNNVNHRFGSAKKQSMQNQNRNRLSGGKSNNFSGSGLMNQVNPWLSQSSNTGSSFNSLGRNIVNDPQAQLALASNLLNNLLTPSQLNKLSQPPSLLSLGNISNASSSFGGPPSFNRDRFNSGRMNQGKIQKRDDFKKQDFKNKRFGNDRKNTGSKKTDQSNKKSADEKIVEKKDTDKNEEVKVENTDKDQSVSEKVNENEEKVEEVKKTEERKEEEAKKPEEVKISYSDIPPALLFCHICRKHMWDDSSFEKHLEGRPHKMMVEELDQSYKLKVDLLRHEMRVMEQQRENDIQRAQRKGKSNVKSQQRGFCTMCNLSFLGMLPAHRKNEKHQRLKKFLHPKCNVCSKEFYTRLEWDDHKLTPAHLKKLAEIRKTTRPDLEDTEFDIADFIEDVNDEIEAEGADIKVGGKRETMDELKIETKNSETTENVGEENGEDNEKVEEKDGKGDEDEEGKKLPKYSPGIPVGENFVVNKTGFLCRACNRFMLTPEDIKIHCQTIVHFNNIIKILKMQNKIIRKRRLNEPKVDEEDKANAENNTDENDESNAKRRKIKTEPDLNGSMDQAVLDSATKGSGAEKYDPEDPESEGEKDSEITEPKISHDLMETKVVLEDINKEIKEEPLQEILEAPKEEKKTPSKTPGRGPRARRGRR